MGLWWNKGKILLNKSGSVMFSAIYKAICCCKKACPTVCASTCVHSMEVTYPAPYNIYNFSGAAVYDGACRWHLTKIVGDSISNVNVYCVNGCWYTYLDACLGSINITAMSTGHGCGQVCPPIEDYDLVVITGPDIGIITVALA